MCARRTPRLYHAESKDLVLISYGNGVALSLAARQILEREHGISARVLDLRWLAPLPIADIVENARVTGRVLVVDECRRSGSPSESIAAELLDVGASHAFARVTSPDSFIPLGEAAEHVLLTLPEVVEAALRLCRAGALPH